MCSEIATLERREEKRRQEVSLPRKDEDVFSKLQNIQEKSEIIRKSECHDDRIRGCPRTRRAAPGSRAAKWAVSQPHAANCGARRGGGLVPADPGRHGRPSAVGDRAALPRDLTGRCVCREPWNVGESLEIPENPDKAKLLREISRCVSSSPTRQADQSHDEKKNIEDRKIKSRIFIHTILCPTNVSEQLGKNVLLVYPNQPEYVSRIAYIK